MEKIIRYQILPELRLVIEFAQGDVFLEDSINLKKQQMKDENFDASYNFIVVANNANMNFNEEQIEAYVSFVKSQAALIENRKSAIITSTPDQVVVYTIYDIAVEMLPMNFQVVSTLETAMNWTNVPMEQLEFLKQTIKELGQ